VPEVLAARGRQTADFIGVNYYTKAYVQWRPRSFDVERAPEVPVGVLFARRKEPASDLGWAIHPEGFRRALRRASAYGVPLFVTENGIADRTDQMRGPFLLSHLQVLAEEIASGLDVRGYFHWSLLDNFEWSKGFWPRFGLFAVDYETLERAPTRSARLYREIIEAHEGGGPPQAEVLCRIARALAAPGLLTKS
jgi:beta-glucosidase